MQLLFGVIMIMKIEKYISEISDAPEKRAESVYQKVADSFEDDLLDFDDFPDGYFEFVVKLLSEESFYLKPGLWNFLMVLGAEKQKMKRFHYESLGRIFIDHYRFYLDEDLCLAVCDFVARNYEEVCARFILDKLKAIEVEKDDNLRGFAADGIRILERKLERNKSG